MQCDSGILLNQEPAPPACKYGNNASNPLARLGGFFVEGGDASPLFMMAGRISVHSAEGPLDCWRIYSVGETVCLVFG
jgi:hypothetical protein